MKISKALSKIPFGALLLSLLLAGLSVLFFLGRPTEEGDERALGVLAVTAGVLLILYALVYASGSMIGRARGAYLAAKLVFAVSVLFLGVAALVARASTIAVILNLLGFFLVVDGAVKLHSLLLTHRRVTALYLFVAVTSLLSMAGGLLMLLSLGGLDGILAGVAPFEEWTYLVLSALLLLSALSGILIAFFRLAYQRAEERRIREEVYREVAGAEAARASGRGWWKKKKPALPPSDSDIPPSAEG